MDGAVSVVLHASQGLNVAHLRYNDRRPFLWRLGRAALTIPRHTMSMKDSGVTVGRGSGWAGVPTVAIADALAQLSSGRTIGKLTSGPTQWLCAALAEEDDLRRFIFSFVGLELLCNMAEATNRARVSAAIATANPTLPIEELLWPSTNKEFPTRNLVFRFAAIATLVSPSTAVQDVAAFKPLAKLRNDMFHGVGEGIDRGASVQCRELLRRYLGLVESANLATTTT